MDRKEINTFASDFSETASSELAVSESRQQAIKIMIFVSRQDEIEQLREIRKRSRKIAQFTVLTGRRRIGKTLKDIGEFTRIDSWWDRRGENEIDMITADDISRNITFYEIKRQSSDINLHQLELKVDRFLTVNAEYTDYHRCVVGLSMDDM